MPYIHTDKRTLLDPAVEQALDAVRQLESDDPLNNTEGNLNYLITAILVGVYGKSYRDINNAVGMLECCKLEFYRRFAAPYETQKAFDNGDVYDPSN